MEARAESLTGTSEVRVGTTPPPPPPPVEGFTWQGAVPSQKWMNFYTKVLSSLVSTPGLKLEVRFEVPPITVAASLLWNCWW